MALDRLAREEELLGDLGIARSGGDERGDLLFALGQRFAHSRSAPRPDAQPPEAFLGHALLGERAERCGRLGGFAQNLNRVVAVGGGQRASEIDAGPQAVENKTEPVCFLNGTCEQGGRRTIPVATGEEGLDPQTEDVVTRLGLPL